MNRIGRRKKKIEPRATKHKAVCLLNSSCLVLHMVCSNDEEFPQKVEKGDSGIMVMKED